MKLCVSLVWVMLTSFTNMSFSMTVTDDLGNTVSLNKPAERIVTLAPHIVENLFHIGAGQTIIATVDHSDYPAIATKIPRIGSSHSTNYEKIIELQPDLVIAWTSGKGLSIYQKLRQLGITVYASNPEKIEDVARSLRNFGALTGKTQQASRAAEQFEEKHTTLQETYTSAQPVRSFYQVWRDPILTVNRQSIISKVIELCGGINVFANEPALVPKLSIESVISANPQVILSSGTQEQHKSWVDYWRIWKNINAVREQNLYFIPPDLLERHSVRILDGAEILCKKLDEARKK